jgi:hypothetical protein
MNLYVLKELKAEKDNAEVRVDNVSEYQKVVDAEWNILYDKLDRIHKSGAKVRYHGSFKWLSIYNL